VRLDPAAGPTLAALVTAAVFSTTFLSTRLHRERVRALDRALEIDESVAAARRGETTFDVDTLEEQRRVLQDALVWEGVER
jgi:hypothetical protein